MTLQDMASRPPGQRERNKRDKLRRIKDAARTLFVARGFDDTTIREIALRAGVGLGTIFVYAENKRDLLFLSVNEELEEVTRAAGETIDPTASLLDNLLTVARLHYRFFGEQAALSRLVLREMAFYESGAQADRFRTTRQRLIELFGRSVELALAQRAIATKETPQFVGWILFCIFQVELRRWLASNNAGLKAGLGALERALRLFINGLNPTPGAVRRRTGPAGGARGPKRPPAAPRRRPASRS